MLHLVQFRLSPLLLKSGRLIFGGVHSRIDFCENNNVINRGQLGFRKNNRTIDQVTTLKNIINKYVYDNKKKLYTCFVDFKKAFDSIWHDGLFYKRSKNKINGNFLRSY